MLHTMPALALSPAIWLFKLALTGLVQCQERGGEKGVDAGNLLPLNALLRKINIRLIFKYMPVNETHAHKSMPFLEAVIYWN